MIFLSSHILNFSTALLFSLLCSSSSALPSKIFLCLRQKLFVAEQQGTYLRSSRLSCFQEFSFMFSPPLNLLRVQLFSSFTAFSEGRVAKRMLKHLLVLARIFFFTPSIFPGHCTVFFFLHLQVFIYYSH